MFEENCEINTTISHCIQVGLNDEKMDKMGWYALILTKESKMCFLNVELLKSDTEISFQWVKKLYIYSRKNDLTVKRTINLFPTTSSFF